MPVLEAVDNIGIVVSNVLKSQSKLEGLKAKLSDVGTPEGKELLVQSSDWQWLYMIYIYYIYYILYIIYIIYISKFMDMLWCIRIRALVCISVFKIMFHI